MTDWSRVFSEDEHGDLVPMSPAAPPSEDDLQDLIARFPAIVSDDEGDLLLVRREQGVPGEETGADRWSVDHLFVTRGAVPVLLEVKRASDTRIRREVVGQLLDYAANGVAYWSRSTLEGSFVWTCAHAGDDPETRLATFLGDVEPGDFWAQVQANLEAGRLRLVIAADRIPKELARVVEFLNEQMRAEVRAVELRYFRSADGRRTLAPRVIGATEKARAAKEGVGKALIEGLSFDEWLERFVAPHGSQAVEGARRYAAATESLDGTVVCLKGSIVSVFLAEDGRKIYPAHLWPNGLISVSLKWIKHRPRLIDEAVRQAILDDFTQAVGKLSTGNLQGFPAFSVTALANDETFDRYRTALMRYVAIASES